MMASRMNDNSPPWILIGEGEGRALLIVDEVTAGHLSEALCDLLPGK